jgi:hypothetical protein
MATPSIPRTQTSEDFGDPETFSDEGHPLLPNELEAIKTRSRTLPLGAKFPTMDVPRLLEHIAWLNDRLERAMEQRDALQETLDNLTSSLA